MKKTVALLLILTMIFVLFVAVRAENTDTDNYTETSEDADTGTEAEADTDTDTEIITDTDTEVETDTDTATETDTETDPGTDTDPDLPHDHVLVFVEEKEATCAENGMLSHYICSVCGRLFEDENGERETTKKALMTTADHKSFFAGLKQPGCETPGSAAHYVCEVCGKLFKDKKCTEEITDPDSLVIAPTGHSWGEWETTLDAGSFLPGMERRFCLHTPAENTLKITLDAGHGKYDNQGVIDGYYEGRMTFKLMSYLKAELEKYSDITVCTTRQTMDDAPVLVERGTMAAQNGSDVFISIHSNWFSNESACGVSVYRSYFRPESEELGTLLGLAVTSVINDGTGITYMRNDNKPMTRTEAAQAPENGDGVNQDYYNVLRNSVKSQKCRYSFIIEHGFHSNPSECLFLMSDENLQKLAKAEADVLASYFKLYLKGREPVNKRHVQYRQIQPVGTDSELIGYDVEDGYGVNAAEAFRGGTTVTLRSLEGEELENALSSVPELYGVSAFSLSSVVSFWDVSPGGDIYILFPFPENKGEYKIGATLINGGETIKISVNENEAEKAASMITNKTGVFVVYLYSENDVMQNDVNGDGRVDNKDVVALFRYASGNEGVFVEKLASDINKDGEIGNKDVVLLFRILSALNDPAEEGDSNGKTDNA